MADEPCVAAGDVHDFFADTQMPCEACGPRATAQLQQAQDGNARLKTLLVDLESLIAEYIITEIQAQARLKRLEEAIKGMKRTDIGPERSVPEGTEIWFMFADEREAALTEGG